MRVELDINKSVEQNAGLYYDKAKKAKKKRDGVVRTLDLYRGKLAIVDKEIEQDLAKTPAVKRKKLWYEKFRWFITSNGLLVIGGRDSTTNEIIVKKHIDADDLVFHTDMAGSPFFVIKSEGKKIDEQSISETANATCTFSRAFKLGLTTQSVFYVKPEQVTKEAQAGEYLAKGAFMIRGKTNYIDNKIDIAVGIGNDGALMAGPLGAVKKNCEKYIELNQGDKKPSEIAKLIRKKLDYHDLDDIIRVLPAGNLTVK